MKQFSIISSLLRSVHDNRYLTHFQITCRFSIMTECAMLLDFRIVLIVLTCFAGTRTSMGRELLTGSFQKSSCKVDRKGSLVLSVTYKVPQKGAYQSIYEVVQHIYQGHCIPDDHQTPTVFTVIPFAIFSISLSIAPEVTCL